LKKKVGRYKEYTNWIPFHISKEHGMKMKNYLISALHSIGTGQPQSRISEEPIDPKDGIFVLCRLIDFVLISLSSQKQVDEVIINRALDGFCAFHRQILYLFVDLNLPGMKEYVDIKLKRFFENKLSSSEVTDSEIRLTGRFSEVFLLLTLKENFSHNDYVTQLVLQGFALCWAWLLSANPHLKEKIKIIEVDAERSLSFYSEGKSLETEFFEGCKKNLKIFMLLNYFVQAVARPQTFTLRDAANKYDATWGRATTVMREDFGWHYATIQHVNSVEGFLHAVGFPSEIKSSVDLLSDAFFLAKERGYLNLTFKVNRNN